MMTLLRIRLCNTFLEQHSLFLETGISDRQFVIDREDFPQRRAVKSSQAFILLFVKQGIYIPVKLPYIYFFPLIKITFRKVGGNSSLALEAKWEWKRTSRRTSPTLPPFTRCQPPGRGAQGGHVATQLPFCQWLPLSPNPWEKPESLS